MKYALDTNILLLYVRGGMPRDLIDDAYQPFADEHESVISFVAVAEIMVLAHANGWGADKMALLQRLIDKLVIVELTYETILDGYIEIERYNRNMHPDHERSGGHFKMGKNDIWIGATAMATGSTLITADKDFQHLNGVFFDVITIDV